MRLLLIIAAVLAAAAALVPASASVANLAYYPAPVLRSGPAASGSDPAASDTTAAHFPVVYSAHSSSLITPTQQQYLSQDDLGQYAYGYAEPLSAKQEVRTFDGITRGSYSYRDAEGKVQTVDYTADADGFRVAATNLPKAVVAPSFRAPDAPTVEVVADNPAVTAARAAHFAAHQAAKLRLAEDHAAVAHKSANPIDTGAAGAPAAVSSSAEPSVSGSGALEAGDRRLELSHAGQDTAGVTKVYATPAAYIRSAYPIAYQPRLYGYAYPFNARFLATRFFY